MCGIFGHIGDLSEKQANICIDTLSHRGPDGRGIWQLDGVTLGHRRLAVLDVSDQGKQPMSYAKGRYWITYNGEIYNFLEIKNELLGRDYSFSSETDTEVILASYQEWGTDMLHRFNGMWAMGIYDAVDKSLFLSRDRFGVKPLYYYQGEDKFTFSSEVRTLHCVLGKKHPLNGNVIEDIVRGSGIYHGTDQTYLQGVFSLPGGSNLLFKNNMFNVEEWYQLKKVSVPDTLKDQAIMLRELIRDASRLRLRSDVPIGTCLSGGLDSGSISAVISSYKPEGHDRFSHYMHRGFCAAFPGTPLDESSAAGEMVEKTGTALDIVEITPPTPEELEEAMRQCDGPMHALAFYPIWKLYRYIKQHGITVTVDGQGPDEMLGGYRPLSESLLAALQMMKPKWFIDVYRIYSSQGETPHFSSKVFARNTLLQFPVYLFFHFMKKGLLFRNLFHGTSDNLKPARETDRFSNSLDESFFKQFFQSPLPGILQQYDRCSMANGVECRMPFMDYRIVEFIFSLPVDSKIGGGYTKRVLREAMDGVLPDSIRLNKLKIGFNAPIVDWFRGPLRDWMLQQMSRQEFINSRYFNGKQIKSEFDSFIKSGNPTWNQAWKFWPPVHITWWMRSLGIGE